MAVDGLSPILKAEIGAPDCTQHYVGVEELVGMRCTDEEGRGPVWRDLELVARGLLAEEDVDCEYDHGGDKAMHRHVGQKPCHCK